MTASDDSQVPDFPGRLRLDGRNYVVVGAGQGMGRQTCHALAQAGAAQVLCVDIDDQRAREVAEEIGVGMPWVGDATRRDEVVRLAQDASRLGPVDGFVDIIGIAHWDGILDISDDTWDRAFDMCLRHAYLVSQELGRLMMTGGGGTMVFISSVSGLTAAPNHAAYGAAKAGLMAWVQSLAVELGPSGIRANAIAPGTILTPRMLERFTDVELEQNNQVSPVKRIGETSDVAGAALFLTSDLSSFITGRTLIVDGGVSAKFPYSTL